MRQKYDSEQTRARLLEATTTIILRQGINSLTLDAVAQQAGVSKGGLLYHFPSKEALLRGLLEHLLNDFDRQVEQALDPDEPRGTPGRWARAYLRASFDTSERERDLGAAIALIVGADPTLTTVVRESFARAHQAFDSDGLDPVRAALLRVAADGLCFLEVLGFASFEEPLRTQLFKTLMSLTVVEGEGG